MKFIHCHFIVSAFAAAIMSGNGVNGFHLFNKVSQRFGFIDDFFGWANSMLPSNGKSFDELITMPIRFPQEALSNLSNQICKLNAILCIIFLIDFNYCR